MPLSAWWRPASFISGGRQHWVRHFLRDIYKHTENVNKLKIWWLSSVPSWKLVTFSVIVANGWNPNLKGSSEAPWVPEPSSLGSRGPPVCSGGLTAQLPELNPGKIAVQTSASFTPPLLGERITGWLVWKMLWVASTPARQLYAAINLYCRIKVLFKGYGSRILMVQQNCY